MTQEIPGQAGADGMMRVDLWDVATGATNLPDIHILPYPYVLGALARALSGGEFTDAIDPGVLERLWQQTPDLPPHLQTKEAFTERFQHLIRVLPHRLSQVFGHAPADIVEGIGRGIAKEVAKEVAGGVDHYGHEAGVQVRRAIGGMLVARTLTGMEYAFEPQTRRVVEYGPGLTGGIRRVLEMKDGIWEHADLLNDMKMPAYMAVDLAESLGMPQGAVGFNDRGMQEAAPFLAREVKRGRSPQADLVIASKIRFASPREVRRAIRSAYDIGRILIISDFEHGYEPGTQVADMMAWAAERFGDPVQTNTGVVSVRANDQRAMHDAVFVR